MNRVKYGLSEATAWPITSTDADGKPTYGEAIPIPGSVSLSLDAEGEETPFYADNVRYFIAVSNNGYSGSLEIALVPEEFKIKILGMVADTAGVVTEATDAKPSEFALAFRFDGDQSPTRHVLYRCSATRPAVSGSTVNETITPSTDSFDFTASGRLDNHLVKAYADETSSAYAGWNTTPYEPTFTPEGE